MNKLIGSAIVVITLTLSAAPAMAANCTPIYGGGTNAPCASPTTKPITQTKPTQPQGFAPQGNQTKGGVVYQTPQTKKTPPTGPEDLGLITLATSGILGVIVRRFTA